MDTIHRLRWRRDGMVRGDRLLHHGERAVLAWGRTEAQSGPHAIGPMRAVRCVGGMHEQS